MSDKVISTLVKVVAAMSCIVVLLLTVIMAKQYDECVDKGFITQPVPYYSVMWFNMVFAITTFIVIINSITKAWDKKW